uniref:Hsp70 protein n=1 Tax=Musca domestica TaxID=7370 RepID=T1PD55_MUSDO
MVNDAEAYRHEDEKQRERVNAKNSLESYCFQMKATLDDENVRSKVSDSDRQMIMQKCNETISWLDGNQTAEKDEYEYKQKELEKICNPIITRLYQGGAAPPPNAGGMPGGAGAGPAPGGSTGPTIEEVD